MWSVKIVSKVLPTRSGLLLIVLLEWDLVSGALVVSVVVFAVNVVIECVVPVDYIDLAILLRNNFTVPNEMKNCISVDNRRLIIQQMNNVVKAKHIENIDLWTDAFLNYAKILVEKHTTMASELFTYMSIIRGALADATFDRVYMYDQQLTLFLC
jgi:hypothetical protein